MSEKWERHNTKVIKDNGTQFDAGSATSAARIVTAVNNHGALVKALDWLMRERCKLMDEDGNCLCGELYACDAPALLADIQKESS